MAKAHLKPTAYKIVLELEPAEAEALYVALGQIGGCPFDSGRKYTESIFLQMKALIDKDSRYKLENVFNDKYDTLQFKDRSADIIEAMVNEKLNG